MVREKGLLSTSPVTTVAIYLWESICMMSTVYVSVLL